MEHSHECVAPDEHSTLEVPRYCFDSGDFNRDTNVGEDESALKPATTESRSRESCELRVSLRFDCQSDKVLPNNGSVQRTKRFGDNSSGVSAAMQELVMKAKRIQNGLI
jgi:hypothetical protein